MRHFHAHRLAGDLDILVAPVELVGLAGTKQQRDEGRRVHHIAAPRPAPPGGIATHRIVRTVEPLAHQQIMDARKAQFLAPRPRLVLLQQRRSEEHTSELQSLMRISYAVFCLKKKKQQNPNTQTDKAIKKN